MGVVAVCIKLTSKGPVLFKQTRYGLNGTKFNIFKFRTMYLHNDDGDKQATKNDSRVTPIGRFLRKWSIDELPQLFNVFEGTMSLVGPRPHVISQNIQYSKLIPNYMNRYQVLPGITGLAQVNRLRGETPTLNLMEKRVEVDLIYCRKSSIPLDLFILAKTLFVLTSKDTY